MSYLSLKAMVTGVTAICLAAAVAIEAKADATSCPSPIPLGLTTALTGNLALLGTQARNGAEFAVDEINKNGGIAGKQLALSIEDTGASSTDALNAMNRILEGKPVIMAVADDYGLGASKGIQAALAKLGVSPAAITSYAPSDKDMSAQLLEIKDKGADSLILFGRPADVTLVLKQMSDLGIKLTTIGNSSMVAQTTLNNLSAAEADGGYAIGGQIPQTSKDAKITDW